MDYQNFMLSIWVNALYEFLCWYVYWLQYNTRHLLGLPPPNLTFFFDTSFLKFSPWIEAPYKDAAEKTALGGLSLDGFLSEVFHHFFFFGWFNADITTHLHIYKVAKLNKVFLYESVHFYRSVLIVPIGSLVSLFQSTICTIGNNFINSSWN